VPTERHFDRWWRGERRRRPDLLTLTEDDLTSAAGEQVSAADYPRSWRQGDLDLEVTYQFSPGEAADGVTVHVPVAVLNRVTSDGFDWQVPGLRDDLAIALLKSLPKGTRRHFVPAPDSARAALAEADPSRGTLTAELARVLHERTGIRIPPGEWDLSRVPDHLRITFSVDGPGGRVVARGKDLDALRESAGGAVRAGMARAGASLERTGLTTWSVGNVPETFEGRSGGLTVEGYPALVDEGTSVALRVLPDRGAAQAAHRRGGGAHRGGLRRGPGRRAHPRGHPGARRRRGGRAGAGAGRPGASHPGGARAGCGIGPYGRHPCRRARPARQPGAARLRGVHGRGPSA